MPNYKKNGFGQRVSSRLELPASLNPRRLIAGCMSGTSADGVDAALIAVEGNGLDIEIDVIRCVSVPFGDFSRRLKKVCDQTPLPAGVMADIILDLSKFHLEALRAVTNGERIDLAVIHGQTVYHNPPVTWQILNPALIAYGLNVPVLSDLRSADVAHAGQGAPITPLADFILFRQRTERRCIINLGGFCNYTLIPNRLSLNSDVGDKAHWMAEIRGKDVCVCNQLLDRVSQKLFNKPYDNNGEHAANGQVQDEALVNLIKLLNSQAESNRSLGTGDELNGWIDSWRGKFSGEDIARTACAGIASIISRPGPINRRILAGGGVKNLTLVQEIKNRSKVTVELSDAYGIPATYREAISMAVLGALCWDRIPITLPQVTGAVEQFVSGSWVLP